MPATITTGLEETSRVTPTLEPQGSSRTSVYEDDGGPGACIAICDFNHGNEGLVGGAMLCNPFITLPYLFSRYRPPERTSLGTCA